MTRILFNLLVISLLLFWEYNGIELEDMRRLVNAVLDMAERMARRDIPTTMGDWTNRIDLILEAGGDTVIDNAGQISTEVAKQFAESEW